MAFDQTSVDCLGLNRIEMKTETKLQGKSVNEITVDVIRLAIVSSFQTTIDFLIC